MKAIEIQQRRQRILTILNQERKIEVRTLVQKLQVSDETIRKDLAVLVDQGLIKKHYGMAELITTNNSTPVGLRDKTENHAKMLMAQTALKLIIPLLRFIVLDH